MTSNLAADEIAQYGLQLRHEAEARAAQRARVTPSENVTEQRGTFTCFYYNINFFV